MGLINGRVREGPGKEGEGEVRVTVKQNTPILPGVFNPIALSGVYQVERARSARTAVLYHHLLGGPLAWAEW